MTVHPDEARCYIVPNEHGASAACVIDGNSEASIKRFLRQNGKRKCKVVTVAEARELLTKYQHHKRYGLPIPDRDPDGKFFSMQDWINHATSYLGGRNALCVDTKDRILRNGGDFQRAHDEKAYPVRFYYGAGGETPAEQKKSIARAKAALKLQYPWRNYR